MKLKLLAMVGSLLMTGALFAAPAEAKVRLMVNAWGVPYFESYYPPYAPHWRRRVPPPDVYDSSYYDDYGDQGFDESYYDPYYLPPSERPVIHKRVKPAKPAVAKAKPLTSSKPKAVSRSTTTTASTSKADTPVASSKLTCEKAGKIVAGYGFGDVTSKDCEGQVYEFSATRDGKSFLIKLSAASGDLTDVKKIN